MTRGFFYVILLLKILYYVMKLVVDIQDSNVPLFMELMKTHNIAKAVMEVKNTRKSRFVTGLAQSFNELKLYEQGKKKLKNAKDLINELRDQGY